MPKEISDTEITKVLVLAANPKGTSYLRLDQEVREINLGLQRARKREFFDLAQRWAVRTRDLRQALLEVEPQIVHFSGHGSTTGGLFFEGEVGQPQVVTPEALAGLFDLCSAHIKCVVLNACYSEIQAEAISQHIEYVVGMHQGIGDKAAIEFAIGFYDALGAGRNFESAYKFGCNAIALEGISEYLIPTLKVRSSGNSASLPAHWNNEAYVSLHLVQELLEGVGIPRRGLYSHWYPEFRIRAQTYNQQGFLKETIKPVDFLVEDLRRDLKFLVEVKSAKGQIDDNARFQLRKYLQYSDVRFGVLINPHLIEIYEWSQDKFILRAEHQIENPNQIQSAIIFLREFLDSNSNENNSYSHI